MASNYRIVDDEATSLGVYSNVYGDPYTGPVDTPRMQVAHGRGAADSAGAVDTPTRLVTLAPGPIPIGGVHLRLWNIAHTQMLALLPQFSDINCSVEFNDDGNLNFNYPVSGVGAAALLAQKAGLIELYEGGVLVEMGVYDQDADDPADQANDGRLVGVTAPGTLSLLNWAVVYPQAGFNTAQYATFQNVTPGSLLRTLLTRAQNRGTLDGVNGPLITPSFDATFDSAGQTWPLNVWLRYDAGKSLHEVVADLVERGFVDTRMRGLTWDVYVKDTFLAADHPGAFIRLAREVTEAPRQRARAGISTALLLTGDGNLSTEVASPLQYADYGRREGYSGQSGVSVGAILQLIGQQVIQTTDTEREGFTATYDRDAGGPQPFYDYDVGHFVRADWYRDPNTGVNLPVRVRTMALTYDANGIRTAALELNDLFLERDVVLQRRIDALTNGTISTATAPPTPVLADASTPVAPSQVLVTSDVIQNADGRVRAIAIISWPLVTANTDATLFDDDGGYHVSWSIDGSAFTADVITAPGLGVAYAVGLPPGSTIVARVAAADYNGHVSTYTTSVPTILQHDTTAPPPPSKPTVTAFIGSLNVHWDGLDSTGHVMPGDFDHVEAWVATTNNPAVATRMGTSLVASGTIAIGNLAYGVPYFVWLRSVDHAGNPTGAPPAGFSVVADTVGTAPTQVLSPDLGGGAVGPDALMYRDFGNKVPDGSFEQAANRARLQGTAAWASGVWAFSQSGPSDGGWLLVAAATVAPSTVRTLPVITGVEALVGDKIWFTFKAKGSAGATGQAQLVITVRDSTGAVLTTQTLSVSTADGTWYTPPAGSTFTLTFPAGAATYDVAVQLSAAAQAGTWSFDAVNVRQVIQTAVIDQAAIGNAQIQTLAVDEAQIQHVQVEDILAGVLTAAYIALGGGKLTTTGAGQNSGARVELDSLGLRAYSAASTSSTTGKTVEIKSDGTALISGTITGGGLSGGTITGSIIQSAASPNARAVLSVAPPDNVSNVGLLIIGPRNQVTAPNAPGRVTDYAYTTTGAADLNDALRISGGKANVPSESGITGFTENSIIIFPRDQTDEGSKGYVSAPAGVMGCVHGMMFNVMRHDSASGVAEFATLNLKAVDSTANPGSGPLGVIPLLAFPIAPPFDGPAIGWTGTPSIAFVKQDGSGFVGAQASGFTTVSTVELKRDLSDVDHVAIVRAAPARRFFYRDGVVHDTDRPRHGPMIEDLPDEFEVDGGGLDVATVNGVLWGAAHQMIHRQDDLGKRVAELERLVERLRSRS